MDKGRASEQLVAKTKFVADFYDENPEIEKKLREMFTDKFIAVPHYDIIKGISENRSLFNSYYRAKFTKYYSLLSVLSVVKNMVEEKPLLVCFTDLKLYATVPNIDIFNEFASKVRDMIDDNEKVNVNQIILSDQKQKLAFICAGNSDTAVKKLQKYVQTYMKSDSTVIKLDDKIQVTVESNLDIYSENLYNFQCFKSQLADADEELAQMISVVPIMSEVPYKYSSPAINWGGLGIEELKKTLKTAIVHVGGDNNGNININININQPPTDPTRNWILANPPADYEITTDYYDRYSKDVKNPIYITQFSTAVKNSGFTIGKNHTKRYWVRK